MKHYLEVTFECESAEQAHEVSQQFPLFEGNPPVVEIGVGKEKYDQVKDQLADALREHMSAWGGFADAVRIDTQKAYPWPPGDIADENAQAALAAYVREK